VAEGSRNRKGSEAERRRYRRVALTLGGRYMLTDRHEYDCQTIDISASGAAISGAIKGDIGERVVAYFDHIGRIEGMVVRQFGRGFAVELRVPAPKRDRLNSQIESLVKQKLGEHSATATL
jgi:PilZ domain